MFIVHSYALAVILCFVTMLCWGSWGNTQKLAAKTWRYELFYWDYVIGMVLFSLIIAFTLGSIGSEGRPFVKDIAQLSWSSVAWIILGAIVFNLSNILLSASTSIAGLSVAFPLGVGLALVIGVFNNYIFHPNSNDNPVLLFLGVALIIVALICNGLASGKVDSSVRGKLTNRKGIILAILAGIIMSFFSPFVYNGMDLNNFADPEIGKATPYTAMFVFAIGVLLSNVIFNTYVMRKPFVGEPVSYSEYFKGSGKTHLVGMLGGSIWCLATALNYISAGTAGASVSYALGQGAPMIAAIWGVFIWKEFKGTGKDVKFLLTSMFIFFIVGLALIVAAGGN